MRRNTQSENKYWNKQTPNQPTTKQTTKTKQAEENDTKKMNVAMKNWY